MNIHFFAKSDIGRVRTANEDYFLNEKISENEYLFVVADGMGGHQAGDVASKMASETFFETYRALRKKGIPIQAALEQSVRRANSVVFRKAAADIEKRGMGTTFSALVIAGMKAAIAHVGDSRIYLIRKHRIKRLTTDHSFVEKLVEEGRISADEARDHPQKNVLYMSLGARESFTPEMLADIGLEDGDALVMCSDGLSNMVDDESLMNLALGDYPEESAEALVRLANDRGGADNITVQVIRLGSLEMLEKTKPIRLSRPRRKLAKGMAALVLLLLIAVLAYLFFIPARGGADAKDGPAAAGQSVPASEAPGIRAPRIGEIDSSRFDGLRLAAADCRFLSGRRLHVVRDQRLTVFDLNGPNVVSIELQRDEQVVPCRGDGIFLLRREPTRDPGYLLLRQGTPEALLRIRHDGEVNAREERNGGISQYRIAGLQGDVTPDYIDGRLFIFHDRRHYYGIRNWPEPEGMAAAIEGLTVTPGARLCFQNVAGRTTLLHHDAVSGHVVVWRIDGRLEKVGEFSLPTTPPLLWLEYAGGRALIGYAPDQCLAWDGGRRGASQLYAAHNFQLRIVKVLVDMVDNSKVVIDDGNQLFNLDCSP